ncbi:mediator of RNA polymerase II transcription subunit 32-like [Phalaenopsis equestris]|uniref:mediator of RNA polymerase II transcription subunit 32-like n=1 Tax=Phalaenopsis equestris TaxID=78828 RepID=UPI0009E20654|nr:mediator of RNA polymerase II transcription subunit 32-like [Phalaenopsis equestris]
MKRAVDAMSEAFDDFMKAATHFLSHHTSSAGLRTPESETAIQNLREKFELLQETCDSAEDFVFTARRNLAAGVAAGDGGGKVKNDSNADDSMSDDTSAVSYPSPSHTSGSRVSAE